MVVIVVVVVVVVVFVVAGVVVDVVVAVVVVAVVVVVVSVVSVVPHNDLCFFRFLFVFLFVLFSFEKSLCFRDAKYEAKESWDGFQDTDSEQNEEDDEAKNFSEASEETLHNMGGNCI